MLTTVLGYSSTTNDPSGLFPLNFLLLIHFLHLILQSKYIDRNAFLPSKAKKTDAPSIKKQTNSFKCESL